VWPTPLKMISGVSIKWAKRPLWPVSPPAGNRDGTPFTDVPVRFPACCVTGVGQGKGVSRGDGEVRGRAHEFVHAL
jgi:hypothetical protein